MDFLNVHVGREDLVDLTSDTEVVEVAETTEERRVEVVQCQSHNIKERLVKVTTKARPKASKIKSRVVVIKMDKRKKRKSAAAKQRSRQKQRDKQKAADREVRRLMGDPEPEFNAEERDEPEGDTFAEVGMPEDFGLMVDLCDYEEEQEPVDDFEYRPKRLRRSSDPDTVPPPVEKAIWRSLRPLEIHAMSLARKTSCSKELVPMPKVTRPMALKMIEGLTVQNPPKQRIIAYGSQSRCSPSKVKSDTESIVRSIRKYGFCSFDTEGAGKLMFKKGPKNGEAGRSILVIGSPDGEVVIFYDPSDLSQEFVDIFRDPTIFKVQAGIDQDIGLLPFRVFGLVDSGCFVPFLNNATRKNGISFLHKLVFPQGPARVEYNWRTFDATYRNESLHVIHEITSDRRTRGKNDALVHSLQDVFTPIAAVFQIGGFTRCFDDLNRFPLMNDLLELVWAKCPIAVSDRNVPEKDLWISDSGASRSESFEFNSQPEVTRVRAARQHFYESTFHNLEESRAQAEVNCVDGLPSAENVYLRDSRLRFYYWCRNCGSAKHERHECPLEFEECTFPHRTVATYLPHSIRVCPGLHAWCRKCWVHGHETSLHAKGRNPYTAGQLRRDFNDYAPMGLFSSAIFLKVEGAVKKSFYRAGFLGTNRIYAPTETRLAGHVHELDKIEVEAARRLRDRAIEKLETAYKEANLAAFYVKKTKKK